jgi:stress response protein SCP2
VVTKKREKKKLFSFFERTGFLFSLRGKRKNALIKSVFFLLQKTKQKKSRMFSTNIHNLPANNKASIIAGVSWDEISTSKNIKDEADLDLSCIALDSNHKIVDRIFWGKLHGANDSIIHSGDNENGEGAGDDEQITANLSKIPSQITSLFFFLSKYSDGVILPQHNLAARVIEEDKEFCPNEPPLIRMRNLHSVFSNNSNNSSNSKRSFCFCGALRQNNNSWNIVELSMPIEVESALDPVIEKHCPFLVERCQSGGMKYNQQEDDNKNNKSVAATFASSTGATTTVDNKQLHRQQQNNSSPAAAAAASSSTNNNTANEDNSVRNRKSAAPLPTPDPPIVSAATHQQPQDLSFIFYLFLVVLLFLIPIYLAL